MKQNNSNLLYHLVAFITVAIWGTTFVSTKVLMLNGLSPAQIFTLRFSIAYILMLMVNHKKMFADSWKDEFKLAMLGITGGSLYFLSENEAMNYTQRPILRSSYVPVRSLLPCWFVWLIAILRAST